MFAESSCTSYISYLIPTFSQSPTLTYCTLYLWGGVWSGDCRHHHQPWLIISPPLPNPPTQPFQSHKPELNIVKSASSSSEILRDPPPLYNPSPHPTANTHTHSKGGLAITWAVSKHCSFLNFRVDRQQLRDRLVNKCDLHPASKQLARVTCDS